MSDTFNTTVANWQGVDDVPTAGSNNMVKSGSIYSFDNAITNGVSKLNAYIDNVPKFVYSKEWYVSNLIPVNTGDSIKIKAYGSGAQTGQVGCYDSNKVLINFWSSVNNRTVTITEGTYYVSISVKLSEADSYALELNGVEVFRGNNNAIYNILANINLDNKCYANINCLVDIEGELLSTEYGDNGAHKAIKVSFGDNISLTAGANGCYLAFVKNIDSQTIDYVDGESIHIVSANQTYTTIVPEWAKYLVIESWRLDNVTLKNQLPSSLTINGIEYVTPIVNNRYCGFQWINSIPFVDVDNKTIILHTSDKIYYGDTYYNIPSDITLNLTDQSVLSSSQLLLFNSKDKTFRVLGYSSIAMMLPYEYILCATSLTWPDLNFMHINNIPYTTNIEDSMSYTNINCLVDIDGNLLATEYGNNGAHKALKVHKGDVITLTAGGSGCYTAVVKSVGGSTINYVDGENRHTVHANQTYTKTIPQGAKYFIIESWRNDNGILKNQLPVSLTLNGVELMSPIHNNRYCGFYYFSTEPIVDKTNKTITLHTADIIYYGDTYYRIPSDITLNLTNSSDAHTVQLLVFNSKDKTFRVLQYNLYTSQILPFEYILCITTLTWPDLNFVSLQGIPYQFAEHDPRHDELFALHKSVIPSLLSASKKNNSSTKMLQFLIETDDHIARKCRQNAFMITNLFDSIDLTFIAGDMMSSYYTQTDYNNFITDLDLCEKPFLIAQGNHDLGFGYWLPAVVKKDDLYNLYVKPMVDKGILAAGEYTVGKPYYYHDIADYKIRVIVPYDMDVPMEESDWNGTYWEKVTYSSEHEVLKPSHSYAIGDIVRYGTTNGGNEETYTENSFRCVAPVTTPSWLASSDLIPSFKINRDAKCMMQESAQWFLDTLLSTPNDYGVIVLLHYPFSSIAESQNEQKFCVSTVMNGSANENSPLNVDFYAEAVNAFVNGTNFSMNVSFKDKGAYLNIQGGGTYAYSVLCDFSQKNTGAKFICYIGGHIHADYIFRHPTYTNQIQVCPITTGQGRDTYSDITKDTNINETTDSLTVVSPDTSSNKLKLVRIGCDVTSKMKKRDIESIDI